MLCYPDVTYAATRSARFVVAVNAGTTLGAAAVGVNEGRDGMHCVGCDGFKIPWFVKGTVAV